MKKLFLALGLAAACSAAQAQPAFPPCAFPGDNSCVRAATNLIVTVIPTTGTTVTIPTNTALYIVSPAGTLAALTITLPLFGYNIGDALEIPINQAITSLTINGAAGQTVQGAAVSAASSALGAAYIYRWIAPSVWQRVQ